MVPSVWKWRHERFTVQYKVYLRDAQRGFRLSRVVALTKKQETILKTINRRLLRTQD